STGRRSAWPVTGSASRKRRWRPWSAASRRRGAGRALTTCSSWRCATRAWATRRRPRTVTRRRSAGGTSTRGSLPAGRRKPSKRFAPRRRRPWGSRRGGRLERSEPRSAGRRLFLVATCLTLVTEGLLAVAAAALFGDPALLLTGVVRVGVLALLARWAYTGSRRGEAVTLAWGGVHGLGAAGGPGAAPAGPPTVRGVRRHR